MSTFRLVLDTNVLLSSLLYPEGSLGWLRQAWQSGTVCPLVSCDTTAELIDALSYPKFHLDEAEIKKLLESYLPWCETVTVPHVSDLPYCRDPLDLPFLALAKTAKADALVTGDKDLLILAETFTLPILSPASLAERIREIID